LVLVADQRLERNFGYGDGVGHDRVAALDSAFFGYYPVVFAKTALTTTSSLRWFG